MSVPAAMIHWTRQIKEVLNAQDSLQTSENAGPMEELDFWKNRCADLSGISEQLDKLGVKRITEILQIARSSYVNAFLKLSGEIKVRSYFIYTLLREKNTDIFVVSMICLMFSTISQSICVRYGFDICSTFYTCIRMCQSAFSFSFFVVSEDTRLLNRFSNKQSITFQKG